MKKIVWLSNVAFSDIKINRTASWLQPLFDKLIDAAEYEFTNVCFGQVDKIQQIKYKNSNQWILPVNNKDKYNQIASIESCKIVSDILNKEQPELIHIWGTESIWSSIYKQGNFKQKVILDIQGLLFAYSDFYYGSLTFKEIIQSIHMKELIMPWRTLWAKKKVFENRGKTEIESLSCIHNIASPSEWVTNQISLLKLNHKIYSKPFMIRNEFFDSKVWDIDNLSDNPIVFSSCSAAVSYKGIHILIKAIGKLKLHYPNIQLRLAGQINIGNKLLDGYSIFLNKLIKKLDLNENIKFVGSLNADELIDELLHCNVCVVPSFVETYCLAFAEAMLIGVPVVVSYAGAMPELAEDGKEALFYNPSDIGMCASQIIKLLEDKNLSIDISQNTRKRRLIENNPQKIVSTQLRIYNEILND